MVSLIASLLPAHAAVGGIKLSDKYDMPYYIIVDVTNQITTVYDTSDDHVVRQMICSTGRHDATPLGQFIMPAQQRTRERGEWYTFQSEDILAKYATRIVGNFLFHSILYTAMDDSTLNEEEAAKLGRPASHGCIRLRVPDAKYIADNCFAGTAVYIYEGEARNEDLRDLLLERSYTGENGETYNEFLGIPDDPNTLGRFSSGDEVSALQARLKALGYYDGEIDGNYRTATIEAVKALQTALGEEATGQASAEFRDEIQSAATPTGLNVPLAMGDSGPCVSALQTRLKTLKLYDGNIDGEFSSALGESVRLFRQVYGYSDGTDAACEIQKAIRYESAMVAGLFVASPDYVCTRESSSVDTAIVETTSAIRLRTTPDLESEVLDRLENGETVIVLEGNLDGGWAKVLYNEDEGYMKRSYLKRATQTVLQLKYSSEMSGLSYTIGDSAEAYLTGTPFPEAVFSEYLVNGGNPEERSELRNYATVELGDDGMQLRLLASPDASDTTDVLLADGTRAEVLVKGSYWSLISGEGFLGCAPNRFLSFWQGPDDLLGDHLREVSISMKNQVADAEPLSESDEADLLSINAEITGSPTALPIDVKKKNA